MIPNIIKQIYQKKFLFLLVTELLILTCSIISYARNYTPEVVMELSAANLSNRIGELKNTSLYVDESYFLDDVGNKISIDELTTFTSGPHTKIEKGSYTITLYYSTDTDENICYVRSKTLRELSSLLLKTSGKVPLFKENNIVSIDMILEQDIEDFEIVTKYNGSGFLCIDKVIITKTPIWQSRNIFKALIVCMFISLAYYFANSKGIVRKNILCLGLITAAASYSLFTDYMTIAHDIGFHLNRIEGIAQGLQNGIFPVKIHPFWANDYGYAVGVFYGDIFLYLPAILRNAGFTIMEAYKFYILTINLITVLLSWKCFERIFKNNKLGLVAAALFTLSPYRLTLIYTRAAVGEYTALTFLPVILCGFYLIFTEDTAQKGYWKNFSLPALGLTGVIQSHVLSCEMVAVFIIIGCLIMIKKVLNIRVFITLCISAFTTLLLNLGFLVPFLQYYSGDFVINSNEWQSTPIQQAGSYIAQLFTVFPTSSGYCRYTPIGIMGDMTQGVGFSLFFGLILFFYVRFCIENTKERNTLMYFGDISCILGILALYMSTYLFPWDTMSTWSELLNKLIFLIQFPFRFTTIATLFLIATTCYALHLTMKYCSKEKVIAAFSIILCFLAISTSWFFESLLKENDALRFFDEYDIDSTILVDMEYLPQGTNLEELNEKVPKLGDGIEIESYSKKGTTINLYITNQNSDSYIELPLLYYDGYTAKTADTTLSLTNGNNNVILLEVPAQFSGNVTVSFQEPWFWRIAEILSIATIMCIIIGYLVTYIKKINYKSSQLL